MQYEPLDRRNANTSMIGLEVELSFRSGPIQLVLPTTFVTVRAVSGLSWWINTKRYIQLPTIAHIHHDNTASAIHFPASPALLSHTHLLPIRDPAPSVSAATPPPSLCRQTKQRDCAMHN